MQWMGVAGTNYSAEGPNEATKVNPVKQQKEMLAADLKTMRTDPNSLGLSDAERQKMIGQATQQATAQQQAQVGQLGQMALAGGPVASGAMQQAQMGIAESSGDAAVKAATGVNDLHTRMVEQNTNRIRAELDAARERTKENTRFWLNFGIKSVGTLIGAATNPAGTLAGLASGMGSFAEPAAAAAAAPGTTAPAEPTVVPATYYA
jgi:hypothetical protein